MRAVVVYFFHWFTKLFRSLNGKHAKRHANNFVNAFMIKTHHIVNHHTTLPYRVTSPVMSNIYKAHTLSLSTDILNLVLPKVKLVTWI